MTRLDVSRERVLDGGNLRPVQPALDDIRDGLLDRDAQEPVDRFHEISSRHAVAAQSANPPFAWLGLRPLWDRSTSAWFVYSGDGRLRYANAALEQLIRAKPVIGSTAIVPSVIPESRLAYARLLGRLRTEPAAGAACLNIVVVAAEQSRLVSANLLPLPDSTGSGNAVVGMLHEVSAENEPRPGGAIERLNQLETTLARITLDLAALIPPEETDLAVVNGLSPRQQQIVRCLAEGQRPSAIAQALHLSVHTVRNHTKAIFRKLGVHSQSELITRSRLFADSRFEN